MIDMKRVIFLIIVFILMANTAYAAGVPQIGFLSRLNTSEEEFARIVQNAQRTGSWRMLSNRHDLHSVKFYDSLTAMLMHYIEERLTSLHCLKLQQNILLRRTPESKCAVCPEQTHP